MESSVTSVLEAKKEKLQRSTKVFSPDPENRKKPKAVDKVQPLESASKVKSCTHAKPIQVDKDTIMDNLEIATSHITHKNVFTFIKDTQIEDLQSLNDPELLNIITSWKIHKQETLNGMKTRPYDVLKLDIEDKIIKPSS